MSGILSYSVHVPSYRLAAETVNAAWGRQGSGGTKAVANHDEDSLTMAHQAAAPIANGEQERFVFASTTSPFAEKSAASFLAMALDLPPEVRAIDAAGSIRAAARELGRALEGRRPTLIAAADLRLAEAGSMNETGLGDAAAAVALGPREQAIARLVTHHSASHEFTDQWRHNDDRYVKADDVRFATTEGYRKTMLQAISACLAASGLTAGDIARAAVYSPDPKSAAGVIGTLGFDPREQLVADPAARVGLTGAAHPLLLLAALLEGARPGEKLLLAAYGDGADVFVFEATERIAEYQSPAPLKKALDGGRELAGYAKYLAFRGLVAGQTENEHVFASSIMRQREGEAIYRLRAHVCVECEQVDTLHLSTCPKCGNATNFAEKKLSHNGTIFTYTCEHYYPSLDGPTGVCVVDLEGGGRITVQATDVDGSPQIGDAVELTLRKLHAGGGINNYFWKCRPKR